MDGSARYLLHVASLLQSRDLSRCGRLYEILSVFSSAQLTGSTRAQSLSQCTRKIFPGLVCLLTRAVFIVRCVPASADRADRQQCVVVLLRIAFVSLYLVCVSVCSVLQTLSLLLGYWHVNPSDLIDWQQDVVSQHFLLP